MSKRGIAAFFRYARSRHQIYLNRTAGVPREEWTKDPILSTYRFTNIFRELDKTTVWFRGHVRDPMRNTPEVLLATVVFRLLNRIEVGEAVFCQQDLAAPRSVIPGFKSGTAFDLFLATGKTAHLRRAIVANCGDGPYVTGAYIISSPAGYSKLDGVLEVIRRFNSDKTGWWREAAASMLDKRAEPWTLESTWSNLKDFDYFGPFHAYEIVTDLRHTALLSRAPDIMTWANPGPGAHRGANRVFRGDKSARVSREQVIEEMQVLLACSQDANYWPKEWPAWEMREVEHTLCEFDKMERVRLGEGKPRGVYR